ncbi:PEGA domain-containing protein [Occallatibacter riparius]|uniref:PEGA domain-containing protein n=1 Tax=Occallatibacter riparius TaxID=1002689 RepID=A0A9J7BTY4_9BACT|nr:PEGA domain-containing protein [Occallatibacter riparius]UWZ86340.1 PEGA domain-containing protein [Occallatibacter riparius]
MIRTCVRFCLFVSLSASVLAQQAAVTPGTVNNPPVPSTPPPPHTLLDGTPVKLRLTQTISSANAKVGQEIPFEVLEDLKVDDTVVLPKGATAIGTVTEANPKKSMGRGGKLNISITYARLADQEKAALRAVQDNKGGGHIGAMTGAMVATSIVFFPAAPLFLFIHGKDITIPQGTEITAFVQGDMHLDMMKFGAAPAVAAAPTPTAAPAGQAGVYIESTPSGADINVDGNFVGSTPSTVYVAIGEHEITVLKRGFTSWTRKMNVSGPTIHLSADLDKAN